MPILKASIKALRKTKKHTEINKILKSKLKDGIKLFEKDVAADKLGDAQKRLSEIFKVIDKATKKNLIHSNNAAHKKSHMAKLVSKKK